MWNNLHSHHGHPTSPPQGKQPKAGLKGPGYPENVLGQLMHSPDLLGPFLNWWVTSKRSMAFGKRQQVVDLTALVSQYALFDLTNNVLQVPIEASMPPVPGLTRP